MSIPAGTRLGQYEIGSPLGAGGMGEVYRAHDLKLGRDVAIKVLPSDVARQPEALGRFEREARAIAALSHPNILAIHDFGVDNGRAFAVMELLEGQTLRDRLRDGRLPVRKVIEYGVQIARGLAAAHERGFVHRDLKPENIFLVADGHVKILDFGLARQMGPAAQTGTVVATAPAATDPGTVLGTVGYMSPEQVRGETADHRSDLFSLGAVLFEMVTGERAFRRETNAETMTAILRDDPPELLQSRADLPAAFDRVVRHCLEKRAGERFQSARDVAFALETLSTMSGSSSAVAAAPSAAHARRRTAAWLALGVAVALGAAAIWIATRALRTTPAATFTRLTFRRGTIFNARFDTDGRSIVYSASFEGRTPELFSTRRDSPDSRALGMPGADIVGLSSTGQMALVHDRGALIYWYVGEPGVLAQAAASGGASRDLSNNIVSADWSPDGSKLAVVRQVGGKNRVEFPVGTPLYETADTITRVRVSSDGARVAFNTKPFALGGNSVIRVSDGSATIRSLPTDSGADRIEFAWAPNGEIWFTESVGATSFNLRAMAMNGRVRTVTTLPIGFHLYDVARDGTVLAGRSELRSSVAEVAAGSERERDHSWLELSEIDDTLADGSSLLMTEFGEGGGVGRWSVFLRKTDGSPAIRLGEGQAFSLSPDGSQALSLRRGSPPTLVILPTGAGEPRALANPNRFDYVSGAWLHDGKRVGFAGLEPGHGLRYWIQALDAPAAEPITPEGIFMLPGGHPFSPDDRFVAAQHEDGLIYVHPTAGGAATPIPNLRKVNLVRWTADGRGLLVSTNELPSRVFRVDVKTGSAELRKILMPADPAGIFNIYSVQVAANEQSYFYTYQRDLIDLYLIQGLK